MSMMVTIVMVVMLMKRRRSKHLNYGLNFYHQPPRTIFSRGRKIELADFPEELEDGVEEMVVRSTYLIFL